MVLKRSWQVGACLGALFLLVGMAQAAEQAATQSFRLDWAGQVVDIRTNKPLAGVDVYSSAPGRVDAHVGYNVKSGADGRFQIYLPKLFMKSMAERRQPYVLHANYHGQLRYVRMDFIRPMPEEVLFKLIPWDVYIKGQAVSAETGAPLPDIGVALWMPGRHCGSATTDANGNFSFGPVLAFVGGTGQLVSDIRPPGLYTPRPEMVFEEKYYSYTVCAYGKGMERFVDVTPPVKDGRFQPSLPLVSSFDDSIHTYVVLRLPKKGAAIADPSKHLAAEIRGLPPAPTTPGVTTTPGPTAPGPTTPVTTTTPGPTTPVSPVPPVAEPATVSQMTLQAGVRRVAVGQTVTVPVWLIRAAAANITFNVAFDSSVVAPAGAVVKGNLLDKSLFEANTGETGVARIGFAHSNDLTGTGTVAQIPFKAVGKPGDKTALRLQVVKAATASGANAAVAVIHGEVLIVGPDGEVPGDADGDGVLTAGDGLAALKMAVKLIQPRLNADMDKDGQVTSNDAMLILQRVVGKL